MWHWLDKKVTSAWFWLLILRDALGRKERQHRGYTIPFGDRLFKMVRRLSPDRFPHFLPFVLQVVDPPLASYLVQKTLSVYPPPREAVLSMAGTLENADELDLAEMLLWRGVRLFENDGEIWFRLFRCSLRHVLVSLALEEWTRAYHRFRRVAAEAPSVLREEDRIGVYYLFDGADGMKRLLAWRRVNQLWFYGQMEEARNELVRWWSSLGEHTRLPEQMVRHVAGYMLGLGLFATVVSDSHMERTCPHDVAVARWFLHREPLSVPAREDEWTSLLVYTHWVQGLTAGRVKPGRLYWARRLLGRCDCRDLVCQCLLATILPMVRRRVRRRLQQRLRDPLWGWFLPYLHFLCVAAIRLGWRAEALEIRTRIEEFGVSYAAKADLDRLLTVSAQVPSGRRRP